MGGAGGARADLTEYLRQSERSSVLNLTRFVREEIGLRSMLINSQASFGGLAGVLREVEFSDFIDVHGLWSQPQFNAPDAGALGLVASYRVFGKPFVVSEFAATAPSDFRAQRLRRRDVPAPSWHRRLTGLGCRVRLRVRR